MAIAHCLERIFFPSGIKGRTWAFSRLSVIFILSESAGEVSHGFGEEYGFEDGAEAVAMVACNLER